MDFSQRTSQPQPAAAGTPFGGGANKKTKAERNKWVRWGTSALFLAVVVLVVAALVAFVFGGPKAERSYVDSKKLQAVFLNTGQVYFGDIKSLNNKYLVLDNIYYLQTSGGSNSSQAAANTSVSLVKLGCELHSPYDRMVINRDQVTFWENLQDSGQVAKAVKTFQQQNPNGQKCADQSQSTNTPSNGVQGTPSTNTSTNSSTSTKP